MLCDASPSTRSMPVLIRSDAAFCVLVFALAATNGYAGNLCMIHGPKRSRRPPQREAAAILVNSFVVFGIAVGSTASYFIQRNL